MFFNRDSNMASLKNTLVTLPRETLLRLRSSSVLSAEFWVPFLGKENGEPQPAEIEVPEKDLLRLAAELSLDPTNIAQGKIDFRTLSAHQNGSVNRLPERYAKGSSRIRTSAHLFDRIETLFGWRARTAILRRCQVTEAVLGDLDREVNLRFLTDTLDEIRKLGVTTTQFFKIGEQSLIRNYHSPLGELFRASRNTRDLYERCFLELIQKYYDKNTIYRILKLTAARAVIEARPSPDVCASLGEKTPGSHLVCLNKAGGFASLSGYRRLPFADVREVKCIHRGDPACRFEIDFGFVNARERQIRSHGEAPNLANPYARPLVNAKY
jgi:hypothetical protein